MLFIVATPIGNLKDITLRAIETLKIVDEIVCEDTRRALILLNHYQIKKPLLVLNDFNESQNLKLIVNKLHQGRNLALISDAGTPLISDPGYKLVKKCLEENIKIDIAPGVSSVVASLPISGLPPDKFLFLGYLPEKPGHRKKLLANLQGISNLLSMTFIVFISPYKLIKTLEDFLEFYGDFKVTLTKELTKIHQSVKEDLISNWLENLKKFPPKGEYILLFRLSQK